MVAAAIDTGFSTGQLQAASVLRNELPWAHVGVRLAHAQTAKEALQAAGLLWKVDMHRVYVDVGKAGHPSFREFPDKRAVVRDAVPGTTDASRFMGVVSDHYKMLQNEDAFTFFDHVIRRNEAVYHSAGSLLGGRIVFIVAKLPDDIEVVDEDLISQYILLVNSHTGQHRLRMGYLPVRTSDGTVLRSPAKYSASIRHIGTNFAGRVSEVRRELGLIPAWAAQNKASFRRMAAHEVSKDELDKYLKAVFPDKEDDASPAIHRDNVRRIVVEHRNRSAWDVYSSTARYIDTTGKAQKPASRLSSIWFGGRSSRKEKAASAIAKIVG